MALPTGFYKFERSKGLICRLCKSLYSLKQASRQQFSRFSDSLIQFGFVSSLNDYSLFTYKRDGHFLALFVYVNDVLLTGTSPVLINEVKSFIHSQFKIKDLGPIHYFLGIEVARSPSELFLN